MTPEEANQRLGCLEASLCVPCGLTGQGCGGCFPTENIAYKNAGLRIYPERSFIFLYLKTAGRGSQRLILNQPSSLLLDGNISVVPNWPMLLHKAALAVVSN